MRKPNILKTTQNNIHKDSLQYIFLNIAMGLENIKLWYYLFILFYGLASAEEYMYVHKSYRMLIKIWKCLYYYFFAKQYNKMHWLMLMNCK